MCTITQIRQYRSLIDRFISTYSCVICGKTAWSDYYGYNACKSCLYFFLLSVLERRTYTCVNLNGLCRSDLCSLPSCYFCILMKFYRLGFKANRVGRHESECFIDDNISQLRRCPTVKKYDDDLFLECMIFYKNITLKTDSFFKWMLFNPHPTVLDWMSRQEYLHVDFEAWLSTQGYMDMIIKCFFDYQIKGVSVMIMLDSLFMHDVLQIGCTFIDPYKCKSEQIQNFTIDVLEMTRSWRKQFTESIPSHRFQRALIYG